MKDLFQMLAEAKSHAEIWTPMQLKACLASIASAQPNWCLDWEEGDERWIRILSQGKVVGYVSVEIPIAFFLKSEKSKLDNLTGMDSIVIYVVEDFDNPDFSTTRCKMEDVFGRVLTDNVDYERLSVNDLWWATVS